MQSSDWDKFAPDHEPETVGKHETATRDENLVAVLTDLSYILEGDVFDMSKPF